MLGTESRRVKRDGKKCQAGRYKGGNQNNAGLLIFMALMGMCMRSGKEAKMAKVAVITFSRSLFAC